MRVWLSSAVDACVLTVVTGAAATFQPADPRQWPWIVVLVTLIVTGFSALATGSRRTARLFVGGLCGVPLALAIAATYQQPLIEMTTPLSRSHGGGISMGDIGLVALLLLLAIVLGVGLRRAPERARRWTKAVDWILLSVALATALFGSLRGNHRTPIFEYPSRIPVVARVTGNPQGSEAISLPANARLRPVCTASCEWFFDVPGRQLQLAALQNAEVRYASGPGVFVIQSGNGAVMLVHRSGFAMAALYVSDVQHEVAPPRGVLMTAAGSWVVALVLALAARRRSEVQLFAWPVVSLCFAPLFACLVVGVPM